MYFNELSDAKSLAPGGGDTVLMSKQFSYYQAGRLDAVTIYFFDNAFVQFAAWKIRINGLVVPGWHNRAFTEFLSKLPIGVNLPLPPGAIVEILGNLSSSYAGDTVTDIVTAIEGE